MTDADLWMIDRMIQQEQRMLDDELYGAWRAGYDYLYVLRDFSDPDEEFDIRIAFVPSNVDLQFETFDSEKWDLRRESTPRKQWEQMMDYSR